MDRDLIRRELTECNSMSFKSNRTEKTLIDIQKAVIGLMLNPSKRKSRLRRLSDYYVNPNFFVSMRLGPLELEARYYFNTVVRLFPKDYLEDRRCRYPKTDNSRWREFGDHSQNSLPGVVYCYRVSFGNDNDFCLRDERAQPATAIFYFSYLVLPSSHDVW